MVESSMIDSPVIDTSVRDRSGLRPVWYDIPGTTKPHRVRLQPSHYILVASSGSAASGFALVLRLGRCY